MHSLKQSTLVRSKYSGHVSSNAVLEFENAIIQHFHNDFIDEFRIPFFKLFRIISNRMPFLISWIKSSKSYFFVLMGHTAIQFKTPYSLLNSPCKIAYIFDAWEPLEQKIIDLANKYRIDILLFSSSEACGFYKTRLKNTRCFWIPEAVTVNKFKSFPSKDRTIDILQLGRKHSYYHDKISDFCLRHNIKYLHEKSPGQIIFKTDTEFFEGLSRSKVSVCFPSSITHPSRSGSFSTMTRRYLESMASKCLIVGALPNDMKKLFSYNPIVEADMSDPTGQLFDILNNFEAYHPLIEKNYNEVKNNHQWTNRCDQIHEVLKHVEL